MDLEGKIIGNRYEVISKIGNGGMATVYKAKDMVLKRFVAIKILRDEFTTDEEFIKRFNIEAQSAASLTHPNIVSIFDVGNEDNIYYIVMELIQGKTLKQIIDEDGVLPWKWSLNIAIQIASALETAHKNNIIHRDIKPHNIIITEDGIAKVTDFGIAKAVSNSTITAFGTTIGSVHYFSPEHARGGYTDAKSDLYSLGVVLYEMLTGRVPFDADTPVSIALKHMQEKPVEPIKLNPSIPYAVNKIILKAMEKDINLRYQSATEMLKDFSMALKNPEGNFVKMTSNENGYTQVVPTLENEEIKTESISSDSKSKEKSKKKKFFKEHPGVKIAIIIAIIIIIPITGYFITTGLLNNRTKDVELPNFVGLERTAAEQLAAESGVTLEIKEEFSKDKKAGEIISQDPVYMEGYTVKEGYTIQIVVSKGKNVKKVPKLKGLSQDEAENLLKEQELKVEVIKQADDEVQVGYVIKQDPQENEEINAEDPVKIYVSTGIKQIAMEYVIGEKEADAMKKLSGIGFEVTVVYEEDTTKDDGVVLKQSIDTGVMKDDGSEVILTVNKIEQIKEGTVNVNLKSLTGGVIETDEEGNEINPTVDVEIRVTSEGSEDIVYSQTHRKDTENISIPVSGKGTITIKVFINGVRKAQETLNLNSSKPVLNID